MTFYRYFEYMIIYIYIYIYIFVNTFYTYIELNDQIDEFLTLQFNANQS